MPLKKIYIYISNTNFSTTTNFAFLGESPVGALGSILNEQKVHCHENLIEKKKLEILQRWRRRERKNQNNQAMGSRGLTNQKNRR